MDLKFLVAIAVIGAIMPAEAFEGVPPEPWNRTIDVPFTEQPNDYTCGPTSLSMLMAFAGKHVTVDDICAYLGGCPTDGIGETTVLQIANHFGFKGAWATDDAHLTQVKAHIAKGVPVITHMLVGPALHYCDGGSAYVGTYGHYIVTNGFVQAVASNLSHCVVSNDPARYKNTHYDALSFVSVWNSPNGKYRFFVL
eukprot:TRINITY_DN32341_c0_g1_i1.p1 TRINITY_DN32341_c0_g1~~TRINITY_DN32341_c0_g1_i1.p1  ORF type:complete len:196 (-),score=9.47 TRINITY_DN32341_c0_g1_i1:27-614(-)